jgi:hypothetical protein
LTGNFFSLKSRILKPYVESHSGTSFCLVLDSLSSHHTEAVLSRLSLLRIVILFIPGGLTRHIQPVDVGINAAFKHWIRERWATEPQNEFVTSSMKRVRISSIIAEAWQEITSETVSHSFHPLLSGCVINSGEDNEIDLNPNKDN